MNTNILSRKLTLTFQALQNKILLKADFYQKINLIIPKLNLVHNIFTTKLDPRKTKRKRSMKLPRFAKSLCIII